MRSFPTTQMMADQKQTLTEFDQTTIANMTAALDYVCKKIPADKDTNELRKSIADELVRCARMGRRTPRVAGRGRHGHPPRRARRNRPDPSRHPSSRRPVRGRCVSTALAPTNCRPRAVPRCGLSFTTRAFTATLRDRVRTPLPSRLQALRSLSVRAVAAPLPRALNRRPPFPVPKSRFGLPPAPDRPLDLADEACRASTCRADQAPGYLPAAAVADLAGTDTKVVFVARHETTIGSRKADSPRDVA